MRFTSWQYVLATLMLAATALASKFAESRPQHQLERPLDEIPRQLDGWTATADENPAERLMDRLKPASYLSRAYRRGNEALGLSIAFYSRQQTGESMHSPKSCLPGSGWEIWETATVGVPFRNSRVVVNQYRVQKGIERKLVLYWYQSPRRIYASEYRGKAFLLWDSLVGGRTEGSVVRITLPDLPGAAEEGVRFAETVIPEVNQCFSR